MNKILFYILSLNLLVLLPFSRVNSQENSKELTVESIWLKYSFFEKSVKGFRSMNDGEHYTRIEDDGRGQVIVKYAFADAGSTKEIIVDSKEFTFDGEQIYIDEYEFNKDETKLLLTVNEAKKYRRSFYAEYYLFDLKTRKIEVLDAERSPQTLASYSPDGEKVAYIFENNLYVKNIEKNETTQITNDGKRNNIINGTTDWVYEEEFAITKAYDWSPNSEYIAFLKFDESEVKEFTMDYYFEELLYPMPVTFKYPKAGEDNSKVTFHIADLKTNNIENVSLGDYEYIPRIQYSTVENKIMVLTLNRHQNHIKYQWISQTNKGWESKVVYEEKEDAYLEIDDNLYFLKDGKHFIRTSEKSGYNHIYLIGIEGNCRPITQGNWDVISFEGIDEAKGIVYFLSAEEGAPYSSLYSIKLNGKNKKRISSQKGSNSPQFSNGMKYFINQWSTINSPSVFSLHKADGTLIKEIENNASLRQEMKNYNFQPVDFIKVKGAEKDLNAWILYPPEFDSTKQYPVYFYVYGGPGHNLVTDKYDFGNGAYHQLLAQKGYIVLSVDPRGTMYRGREFKKSTYLELGKLETEDLIAVAQNISKWKYVDKDRIGIMGWSYGGYMTSLAMTKGADYFKMGIAVAPVTNWKYYDNIYTERFMRTPRENLSGYEENSPINFVKLLKGKYFIIHGSSDDNVHLQNTMEMVNALTDSDKDFDLFIYPNRNHGIYGGNTRNHLYRMLFNYTLNNL